MIRENYCSIRTDDDCRRPPVPGPDRRADRYSRQSVRVRQEGLERVLVYFPAAYELSAGAATALSVVLVAFVCFLAGLLARTVTAQHIVNALESSVLSKIPAYEYLAHGRGMAARPSNRTIG
jgi:hypothetical protein